MKTDLYLKTVLTVIALCLVVLTLQNLEIIPRAHAVHQPPTAPECITLPLNPDGTVDVNIKRIEDKLSVNIEQIGGYGCYNGIPVIVKER